MINETQYWPIFKEEEIALKFWNRDAPPEGTGEWQKLLRLSTKKNSKPTQYEFAISKTGVLLYKGKNIKGWLLLNLKVSAKITDLQSSNRTYKVIRLRRNDQVQVYLWHVDQQAIVYNSQITLQFYKAIAQFAVAQNFDVLYSLQEEIGKGGFAKVYRLQAHNLNDKQVYAGKVYTHVEMKAKKDIKKFVNFVKIECNLLKRIDSPYVLKLYEIHQLDEILVLVSEYIKGGTLYTYLKDRKRLSEDETIKIIVKLCLGLKSVHELGYVHRDIKLENVLIDGEVVKLIDFGFAELINRNQLVSGQGTAGYIAPEVFQHQPYTEISDVFSMGVIFYALLSGRAPFKGTTYDGLLQLNKQCNIEFSEQRFMGVSQRTMFILKGMLRANRQHRVSLDDVITYLTNPDLVMNISQESMQSLESSHNVSLMQSKYTMKSFFVQSVNNTFSDDFTKKSKKSIRHQGSFQRQISKSEEPRPTRVMKQSTFKKTLNQIKQHHNEDSIELKEEDCRSSNGDLPVPQQYIQALINSFQIYNLQKFKYY